MHVVVLGPIEATDVDADVVCRPSDDRWRSSRRLTGAWDQLRPTGRATLADRSAQEITALGLADSQPDALGAFPHLRGDRRHMIIDAHTDRAPSDP